MNKLNVERMCETGNGLEPAKGRLLSSVFHSLCAIMSSDEDQPIVQDLFAGFDVSGNLVVVIDNVNYYDERYCCSTAAVVRRSDAMRMARRLKVAYHKLPLFICECMEEWNEVLNPTFNQVQDCFKEIIECLIDEGCRIRFRRTKGRHGFTCC